MTAGVGQPWRRAGAWLAVLALGVGAILYMALLPARESRDAEHGGGPPDTLLPVPFKEVTAIELVLRGAVHRFERAADGRWYFHRHAHKAAHGAGAGHTHQATPEFAPRIARTFETFGRARVERTLARGGFDRATYGVDTPELILFAFVAGKARPAASFYFGDVAPDRLSRYVLATGRRALVTIPDYHATGLLDLLADLGVGAAPDAP